MATKDGMTTKGLAFWCTIGGVVAVAAAAALAASLHRGLSTVDAAAIIAITGAAAVGIERVIEVIWTVLGQFYGTWFPIGPPSKRLKEAVDQANAKLEPFFEAASVQAGKADTTAAKIDQWAKEIKADLAAAGSSSDLLRVSADAAAQISAMEKKLDFAVAGADLAKAALDDVTDFLGTFESNPVRRIISLFIGMVLGLAVAAFVGLDCITAALAPVTEEQGALLPTVWGMLLTGLLIGLGSNPTHEVIKALQMYKQRA